jgi:hypothetical protein
LDAGLLLADACVAPRHLSAEEKLMGRFGGMLLAVLGLASARFTEESAPLGNDAPSGAEELPLPLARRRGLGSPTAALESPRAVSMKIAVGDVRADVLVSLSIYEERSTRRCH